MKPLDALVMRWTARSGLRGRAVSWSWFESAFGHAMDAQAEDAATACQTDLLALSTAFFAWAEAVDAHASYEALDEVDFRHFICGLLLQQLLAAQPPVLATGSRAQRGVALTRFVLSLLQALRLDAGARPVDVDPAFSSDAWVASFLENAQEDATSAIAFLDQMTGLEPAWRVPSLIESRPAMQKALART
ncbi:MAG: hypothetical protein EOO54_13680 [Haliea sp.]|nr:MAG: hypothetical protein EOO54_13680 [Haliea sp.]